CARGYFGSPFAYW
nr:immunoglobulin heavy chain junction region [Mus musculus]